MFKDEEFTTFCPECNSPMKKRKGRRGEFYGCSNFFKTGCKGFRTVKSVEIYDEGKENFDFDSYLDNSRNVSIEHENTIEDNCKNIELVPTSKFPYLSFKFENFNPVQSKVFECYSKDVNCVIAAATSAGKTTVAEMFMSYSISQGKKAIFLSPLKAVSQEKYEDWTNPKHDWSKLNISILTGDYQLTEKRVEELNRANIVIMTTEMLDSRTRRINIEKNNWLLETGTIVQDESHLLCVKGRGDKTESAIMRFTKQNPSCRVVFLSATMPNVEELSGWLTSLNNKKTELINSNYRPCQLDVHYESYDDYGRYRDVEINKIKKTLELGLDKYSKDEQVLIFVHSKNMGKALLKAFLEKGVLKKEINYHHSELSLSERNEISKRTKSKEIKILIATSGLAWGINI